MIKRLLRLLPGVKHPDQCTFCGQFNGHTANCPMLRR